MCLNRPAEYSAEKSQSEAFEVTLTSSMFTARVDRWFLVNELERTYVCAPLMESDVEREMCPIREEIKRYLWQIESRLHICHTLSNQKPNPATE